MFEKVSTFRGHRGTVDLTLVVNRTCRWGEWDGLNGMFLNVFDVFSTVYSVYDFMFQDPPEIEQVCVCVCDTSE